MTARERLGAVLPVLVPVALVAAVAAGCGGGTPQTAASNTPTASSTPSSAASATVSVTPTPSATPTSAAPTTSTPAYQPCAQVWVAGQRLRGRYYGCTKADGKVVEADNRRCYVGHDLETYDNRFYAQETGKIFTSSDLRHDPKFADAVYLCEHAKPRS